MLKRLLVLLEDIMNKQIHYKAIFQNNQNQNKVEYCRIGNYEYQESLHHLSFDIEETPVHISYNEHQVKLVHGTSELNFKKDIEIANSYQTPYGNIEMISKIRNMKADDHKLHLIYDLYQDNHLITTVYLLVKFEDIHS